MLSPSLCMGVAVLHTPLLDCFLVEVGCMLFVVDYNPDMADHILLVAEQQGSLAVVAGSLVVPDNQ